MTMSTIIMPCNVSGFFNASFVSQCKRVLAVPVAVLPVAASDLTTDRPWAARQTASRASTGATRSSCGLTHSRWTAKQSSLPRRKCPTSSTLPNAPWCIATSSRHCKGSLSLCFPLDQQRSHACAHVPRSQALDGVCAEEARRSGVCRFLHPS